MKWLLKGAGTRRVAGCLLAATAHGGQTLANEQPGAKGKIGVFPAGETEAVFRSFSRRNAAAGGRGVPALALSVPVAAKANSSVSAPENRQDSLSGTSQSFLPVPPAAGQWAPS